MRLCAKRQKELPSGFGIPVQSNMLQVNRSIPSSQLCSRKQGIAMPNDTEIIAYAKSLPDIYRDILAAFPAIEPGRNAGYGLAFQTLAMHFANTRRGYS